MILVAPGGQAVSLFRSARGNATATNATLIFSSAATTTIVSGGTSPVVSGVYAPSDSGGDPFAAPAPGGPYLTSFATLLGTNPVGDWKLYVFDRYLPLDNGSITGGWSLAITPVPSGVPSTFTYQGVVSNAGGRINGAANVRFTLASHPTIDLSGSQLGAPVTVNFPAITNGLITASLTYPSTLLDAAEARWLNIEVESPPGSGFVTLSPRQALTPTPQARFAASAGELAPGVQRWLYDQPLYLRAKPDNNAALRWFGGPLPFAGVSGLDGALAGC